MVIIKALNVELEIDGEKRSVRIPVKWINDWRKMSVNVEAPGESHMGQIDTIPFMEYLKERVR